MRQSTSESEKLSRKRRFETDKDNDNIEIQYFQVVEEINLLKKFSNPHIIRFIEAFENPGEVILIKYKYKY